MAPRSVALALAALLLLSAPSTARAVDFTELEVTHQLEIELSLPAGGGGSVLLGLFGGVAPRSVANYRELCLDTEKGYPGSRFHRIIANFMIQGGGIGRSRRALPARRTRCSLRRLAAPVEQGGEHAAARREPARSVRALTLPYPARSIYGGSFDDEPTALAVNFTAPGLLSMARLPPLCLSSFFSHRPRAPPSALHRPTRAPTPTAPSSSSPSRPRPT